MSDVSTAEIVELPQQNHISVAKGKITKDLNEKMGRTLPLDTDEAQFLFDAVVKNELENKLKEGEIQATKNEASVDRYKATHDELTGLYNRKGFDEELLRISKLKEGNAVVAMFDLNELKKINDTLGHAAGDKAIKNFADILKLVGGVAGRWGGDEFGLILQNKTLDQAVGFWWKFNKVLETGVFITEDGEKIQFDPVRISVGFSELDYNEAAESMRLADLAMLKAKATSHWIQRNYMQTSHDLTDDEIFAET